MKSIAELARNHGNRVVLKVSASGRDALSGAKALGKAAHVLENLVRETFESFCYWLADRDFQPAYERLFIGVRLWGVSAAHIVGTEFARPDLPKNEQFNQPNVGAYHRFTRDYK